MLQLSAALIGRPVMSLRTGGVIGATQTAIINPNNLKIEGFYCEDRFSKKRLILLTQDVRDILNDGLVVNDHEVLTEPEDLIRLKEIIEINFELIGKPVQTADGQKVGKVADFAADKETLYIQKLYVSQSLIKSFGTGQISIDRNQIVEVTNRKVVIKELLKPERAGLGAPAPA